MLKQSLSIFFTVLFMAFTIVPSILVLVDDSIDISILMNISEEEEERADKNKNTEVFVTDTLSDSNLLSYTEKIDNLGYTHKNYPIPHLNLISPPPDYNI